MSNKLYGSRVYLAGPMDRVKDGGIEWREDLTPFLQDLGIIVLDPCKKPTSLAYEGKEQREIRRKLLRNYKFNECAKQMKEIRRVDLRMVDVSDFLITYWDMDVHICGTLEEVFWANREKKPVLVMCKQGKKEMPHWMFGVLPHNYFFDNWDNVKYYINNVNNNEAHWVTDINTMITTDILKDDKRWTLFDYEKLMPCQ